MALTTLKGASLERRDELGLAACRLDRSSERTAGKTTAQQERIEGPNRGATGEESAAANGGDHIDMPDLRGPVVRGVVR
jgi:hypothetical protein